MKQILCISRHAPYSGNLAREALDTVLAAAVFDQAIGLLFMDDGVYQLLQEQQNITLDKKNISIKHPIKTTGSHTVPVKLKEGVTASFKLEVVSEESHRTSKAEEKSAK